MSSLSAINNLSIRKVFGNRTLNHVALSVSTAAVVSAAAVQYSVDGLTYVTGGAVNANMVVTHDSFGNAVDSSKPAYVQPASTTVHYVLALNAAGTIAVVQGSYLGQSITDTDDLSKVLTGNGGIPTEPDGYVAFGLVTVVTAPAVTYTPGTTSFATTGVVETLRGVSILPASI